MEAGVVWKSVDETGHGAEASVATRTRGSFAVAGRGGADEVGKLPMRHKTRSGRAARGERRRGRKIPTTTPGGEGSAEPVLATAAEADWRRCDSPGRGVVRLGSGGPVAGLLASSAHTWI